MKKRQLLASLAVGTAMVAMAAPVNPTFELKQDVAFAEQMTAAGTLAWADYNNDGRLDYLIVSGQGSGSHIALYRQEADGTFTDVTNDGGDLIFAALSAGCAVWIDYDNDGCLDLIVAGLLDGNDKSTSLTYVFHNGGASNDYKLIEQMDLEDLLPSVSPDGQDCQGIIFSAADFDNDGWTDLLIAGYASTEDNYRFVKLYRNAHGTFEPVSNPEFVPMSGSTVYAADFNNDGLMDFVMSGYKDDGGDAGTSTVYLNKGDLTFDVVTGFGFGQHQGTIFPIDVNNDGKMDIIETGRSASQLSWGHVARVYINNGDGTSFTSLDETVTGLAGSNSCVAFGDINNDGLMDYMSSGWCDGNSVKLFLNNGDNTFTNATEEVYPDQARARDGDVTFVDYNNDGKLDISIYGYRDGGDNDNPLASPVWPNYLVVNASSFAANQAPTAPVITNCVQDGNDVVLTWQASTDDTTPSAAIRYNVYAKSNKDGSLFCLAPANIETGFLKVNRTNPFIGGTSYRFKGMNFNDYTFGVQAVDNGFMGSKFAAATSGVNTVKSGSVKTFVANGEINIINKGNAAVSYVVYGANGVQVAAGVCAADGVAKVSSVAGIYVVKVNAADGVAVDKVVL